MDCLCAEFGYFSFSRFGFIMRTELQAITITAIDMQLRNDINNEKDNTKYNWQNVANPINLLHGTYITSEILTCLNVEWASLFYNNKKECNRQKNLNSHSTNTYITGLLNKKPQLPGQHKKKILQLWARALVPDVIN